MRFSLMLRPKTLALRYGSALRRMLGLSLLATGLLLGSASTAAAKPKVHTVYAGQRLGSIAKRYNVSVDDLCRANGISRRDPIKPGQKLIIPGTDDKSSSSKSKGKEKDDPERPDGAAKVHVVAKGHTLGAIAGRYAVTVSAICNANGISRNTTLEVGQKLIIPHKTDKDGAYARKQRLRGHFDDKVKDEEDDRDDDKGSSSKEETWKPYVKPAWRRGYIKIFRYGRSWNGYVIGPSNEVLGHASNKINFVMGAKEDGPRIDPKLIRLIASISDKFGGREMRIVSGYRTKSFVAASKHKEGKAIDFSIPGIPNEVLRDYLRTIKGVGVGYYPNSSFVHLDVRGYNSYWVDYAGPGEAPKKSPGRKRSGAAPSEDDASHGDEDHEDSGHDEEDHDHGDTDASPKEELRKGPEKEPSSAKSAPSEKKPAEKSPSKKD